jgi:PhnB protein
MSKKVNKIPKNYHSITPALAIKDAAKALEFYKKIFGAKVVNKLIGSNNEIVHSELMV